MDFEAFANQLYARFPVDYNSTLFLPVEIFGPRPACRTDSQEFVMTKNNEGTVVSFLPPLVKRESAEDLFIHVPVQVSTLIFHMLLKEGSKTKYVSKLSIINNLESGATLSGNLLCFTDSDHKQFVRKPIRLAKDCICVVHTAEFEIAEEIIVHVDFSSFDVDSNRFSSLIHEITWSREYIGDYLASIQPISRLGPFFREVSAPVTRTNGKTKFTKEAYGEQGLQKLKFVITFYPPVEFAGKKVKMCVRQPTSTANHFISSKTFLVNTGSYSYFDHTLTDEEVQTFEGYLICI